MLNLGNFRRNRSSKDVVTASINTATKTITFLSLAALGLWHNLAYAVPIDVNLVRSNTGDFLSIGYDAVTGTYYSRQDFGFQGNQLREYADLDAFRNDTSTQTHTVQNYGTYFAVRDGKHFGRSDNHTNTARRVDIATGAVEASANISGMGGQNSNDTFDWSGFSTLNFMNSASGMYVMGGDSGHTGSGLIYGVDEGFNLTAPILLPNQQGTGQRQFGWGFGFIIGDQLFLGEDYNSSNIVAQLDLGTGAMSAVDFTFEGVVNPDRPYWANTVYDHLSDTLLLANRQDRTLYEVTGAAALFGVTVTGVPEPGTIGLLTLGAGLVVLRRRKTVR